MSDNTHIQIPDDENCFSTICSDIDHNKAVNTELGDHLKDLMMNTNDLRNCWIKLNVGGKLFLTTKQTLCRDSGSFLSRLCKDDASLPSYKDETGSYLIDRDSDYFSTVLNWLRHGKLVLDHGLSIEGLREEAEFYNLFGLIKVCNERIAEEEKKTKSKDETCASCITMP